MVNDPPPPLSVLPTTLHGVIVTVAGEVIKGLPQELLSFWGGP